MEGPLLDSPATDFTVNLFHKHRHRTIQNNVGSPVGATFTDTTDLLPGIQDVSWKKCALIELNVGSVLGGRSGHEGDH